MRCGDSALHGDLSCHLHEVTTIRLASTHLFSSRRCVMNCGRGIVPVRCPILAPGAPSCKLRICDLWSGSLFLDPEKELAAGTLIPKLLFWCKSIVSS